MSRSAWRITVGALPLVIGCTAAPGPGAPSGPTPADPLVAAPPSLPAGVSFARSLDERGPWAVHVLTIDLRQCRPELRAVKAGPPLSARAPTSALGRDALAAINADFFELPGGMTVGAHVSRGTVRIGPGERPVFAWTAAGPVQGQARLEGFIAAGPDTVRIAQYNRAGAIAGSDATVLLAADWLRPDTMDALGLAILAAAGDSGRAVVIGAGSAAPPGLLVQGGGDWVGRRAAGDTVAWRVRVRIEDDPAVVLEAVGGFPVLLRGGRSALDAQPGIRPDFGERRHPRTAIGWNRTSLFWVVVDGRQPPYSDGMTLPELAGLLLRLGARDAINLDGGGSSAMTLRGRVVNRPSDPAGERAVGNALRLERCTAARG